MVSDRWQTGKTNRDILRGKNQIFLKIEFFHRPLQG